MIPIVDMMKTMISWIVICSPMIRYAMIDVKNGFSKIRITFDVEVNLSAMNMIKCAAVVPTTRAITYGSCHLEMPSKNEVLTGSPFRMKVW